MKTLEKPKYNQVLTYVRSLSEKDRNKLFNTLKKEQFKEQLAQLRKSVKKSDLSFEDITKEVEIVRSRRYAKQRK